MQELGQTILNIICSNFLLFFMIFNIYLLPGPNFYNVLLKSKGIGKVRFLRGTHPCKVRTKFSSFKKYYLNYIVFALRNLFKTKYL